MASKMATQGEAYDISETGSATESARCVRNDELTDFGFSTFSDRSDNQLIPLDGLEELLLSTTSVTYDFTCNPAITSTGLGIAMYIYVAVGNTRLIDCSYEPDSGYTDCSEEGDGLYTGSNSITLTIDDQGSSDDYTVTFNISYTTQSGSITTKNNQTMSVSINGENSATFTADDAISYFSLTISRIS